MRDALAAGVARVGKGACSLGAWGLGLVHGVVGVMNSVHVVTREQFKRGKYSRTKLQCARTRKWTTILTWLAPFTEPERTQWDHLSTTPPERSDSSSCDGRRECRRDGDRAFVGLPSADSRRLPVGLTAVRAFARLAPKKRTSLDSLIVDGVAVLLA